MADKLRENLEFRRMKLRFLGLFILLLLTKLSIAQEYNILDYGAVGDAKKLNTQSIQAAIDDAFKNGGGKVIIPSGRFLSGSIRLKSNVHLHLNGDAVLLGSTQPAHYYAIQRWKALILADSATNISIGGKGIIDGQGAELALRIDSLFYAGDVDSADYNFKDKRPKADIRPQIIEMVNCKDIEITDVTIMSAASWVQSYFRCADLLIDGIKVDSDTYWNNDGIDIIDSRNVIIRNCDINASDDGICLKSYAGGYDGPQDWSMMCDNILIEDCKVRSSASAVKLGTSSYRGFKNITIRNILVYDTYRSAIAIESYHNGLIENVLVENINATWTGNALFVRLGQFRNDGRKGGIRNVTIRNMKVEVPITAPDELYEIRGPALPFFHNIFPSSIVGLADYEIEDITLENIEIIYPGGGNPAYANLPLDRLDDVPELPTVYPEFSMFGELPSWGLYVRHVKGLTLKNIKLTRNKYDYRPAIVFDDANELLIEGLELTESSKMKEIIFHNCDPAPIH
ncbi:MAG: glycoside hydrolase [Flavobacteriales bacterium]|nr:glycoside hydrolase [Flavobacteriales bacterium]